MFTEKTITINRQTFHYWEHANLDAPVIVFLHGFPGSHGGMIQVAKAFGQYRLLIPDLPGCGASQELVGVHTLSSYVVWLERFLQRCGVRECVIVGHSFGARMALEYSLRNPSMVKSLVFITPVVKVDSVMGKIAIMNSKVGDLLPPSMRKAWMLNKVSSTIKHWVIFKSATGHTKQKLIDIISQEVQQLSPRANSELLDDFSRSAPLSQGPSLAIDTLVVAGGKDQFATVNSIKELRHRLPRGEFKVIEHSGHLATIENPKEVAQVIADWLSTNKSHHHA